MQRSKDASRAFLSHKKEIGPVRGALLAFALSLLASAVVLVATAITLSYLPSGLSYLSLIGACEGLALAFFGGLAAGKLGGRSGLLAGVIYGVLYFLMMLLLGYLFPAGAALWRRVIGYVLFPLLATAGGALGGMRPTKRRHAPHRRR